MLSSFAYVCAQPRSWLCKLKQSKRETKYCNYPTGSQSYNKNNKNTYNSDCVWPLNRA